ncbi:MAG: DNA repair protein RadC [Rhodocyclaceae bacterium]|nr:DNA repair protein RadC [Rhodocyclaceae bacterium]MBX3669296.1 DNA repair protein RadC [Rhodocyclaceae bacterium]
MTISDWPVSERPREKLLQHGAQALSPAELLAICLRTGVRGKSAVDVARDLLERYGGRLLPLIEAPIAELSSQTGLGPAKAAQLKASLEISRRALLQTMAERDMLGSPAAVRDWLRLKLAHLGHEVFMVLLLDAQNRLIEASELFRGTLTQTSVYPREVVKLALARNASGVIFAHNHPSGTAEPSRADECLTQTLKQALALIDVRVLDHFIVAGMAQPLSFSERGLL